MPEEGRRRATYEPGHRYQPRRSVLRVFDVGPAQRGTSAMHSATPLQVAATASQPNVPTSASKSVNTHQISHKIQAPPVSPHMSSGTQDVRSRVSHPHFALKPAVPRQKRSLVLRRQIRDHAAMHSRKNRGQKQRFLLAFGFGGLVTGFVLLGAFLVYGRNLSQRQEVLSAKTARVQSGGPSESAVSREDVDTYAVPGNQPRVLRIPRLEVRARVYPVQTSMNGEPLAASNIYDVGWLGSGVVPGEPGAALFNGSTAGPTKNGVFAWLANLAVGDEVRVHRGDGAELTFTVVSSKSYDSDKVDMKTATQSAIAGKPGLNLLTDTGRFNVRTNAFEQRLLVRTVLKD